MDEIEKIFNGCEDLSFFTAIKEENLQLYQKRGYLIFKTAKISDQTNIVLLGEE